MPLIYETQDDYGVISVFDDGKYRLLSFAQGDEQSRIQLKTPHVLQHEYTQAMLLALMGKTPKRTCILGLGGGALVHALNHAISGVHITAVELRPEIIEVAKEYFRLPQGKRFDIVANDAIDFIKNNKSKKFDILFTDLYQHFGMDKRVATAAFLTDAKQQLKADGMLVLNCWEEHQYQHDLKESLLELFSHVYALDTGCGNWVVFASDHHHEMNLKQQKTECERLSQTLGFALQKWLSRLEEVV
ncbi:spermidine synthase [Marinomonas ostreistagni]|uniref:spermidine synthase n=1 Tax=Marinomonas ostreistagni TaxID=359209 RepID=UPI00195012F6|nr:fused MFS/spermidine synthase [Marinomonas ostreistagni]MBM6550249.1 fused MFS/spermidine synthase [Marinomonas ostreistagni]